MNYNLKNSNGQIIGYVVNSISKEEAERMAKHSQEEWITMQQDDTLDVPSMFSNCFMDVSTVVKSGFRKT